MNQYEPVIGLEVHIELNTKSKMFCSCSADYFGQKPNTHTCPVCLGLPGALPYTNENAIKNCVKIGIALNCEINKVSRFERKNYFYPDLPKGYQISQYRWPLCINGSVEVKNKTGAISKIRINRVHQEEDTAKLIHQFGTQSSKLKTQNGGTLIDFNRSGVPLVEIVTEPDFRDVEEVKNYAKKLQQIFRYLEVSNADMERGDMRLEANISVRKTEEQELPNYRVELKNINSFRFMLQAIEYEIERQIKALEKEEKLTQETRGWNENKKITYLQRSKEEAHDYRYFPEPDIPPIEFDQTSVRQLADQIPELPDAKLKRFIIEYKLSDYNTEILTREKDMADYYETAVKEGSEFKITPKQIANEIINKKIDIEKVLPGELIKNILSTSQKVLIGDNELEKAIQEILSQNQKAVDDYKKGKTTVIMFLVGQVMKKVNGKADANKIKELLEKRLNE